MSTVEKILPEAFFDRPARIVARELLGKYLAGNISGRKITAMIVEVEAYDGPHDKASHAHRGKTLRNAPMFGPAGVWYIYLIYGMYRMLNIVTGPQDYPAAVLIRGIITEDGKRIDGPGRLTKYFGITKDLNGKSADKKNNFWFEDRGVKIPARFTERTARIGVDYAGPVWSKKRYRFLVNKRFAFNKI
jgi:DNA-3-methyladenine glycosylase